MLCPPVKKIIESVGKAVACPMATEKPKFKSSAMFIFCFMDAINVPIKEILRDAVVLSVRPFFSRDLTISPDTQSKATMASPR